jgi:hypothetical protein
VVELARRCGVTTETVRRDLDQLETSGLLQRVHGGAIARTRMSTAEPSLAERSTRRSDAKLAIAARALDAVPRVHGLVYLDAGTTTAALAGLLAQRAPGFAPMEVVTHSMTIAHLLAGATGLGLTAIGGRVRGLTAAAVGAQTVDAVSVSAPTSPSSEPTGCRPLRAQHARPGRSRREARRHRRGASRDRRGRCRQVRCGTARLVRAASDIDILVTDRSPADLSPTLATPMRRCGSHDRHPDREPSLDRTVALSAALAPGEVQTAASVREDAGGKGINVTRVLRGSASTARRCSARPATRSVPC